MAKVQLGQIVKDRVTGFTGMVVAISTWLNGCNRIGVQSQTEKKDGLPIEPYFVDEQQLDIIEEVKEPVKEKRGGPMPDFRQNHRM